MEKDSKRNENFFVEVIKFSIIAIIIVAPIRILVAQPFIVSGMSMDPTFKNGQYLIVDQLSYRFEEPERGDVIIFRFPFEPSKFFIKRIAGLPGETIELQDGELFVETIDGEITRIDEPYVSQLNAGRDNFESTLSEDEYFVLGDNRVASSDSRVWGSLPRNFIVGRAFLRLFPLTEVGVLPGAIEN